MATDTGIVTIYDLKNKGKSLTCHRIDAREFLAHKSGRWSISPDGKKTAIKDAEGTETDEDTGAAMRLKAMTEKALRAMAGKELIQGCDKMNRSQLVEALLAKSE